MGIGPGCWKGVMRDEAPVTVDRGQYEGVTPWEQDSWQAAVAGWVTDALAAQGLRATGGWRVRLRPWSVLVRRPERSRAGAGPARTRRRRRPLGHPLDVSGTGGPSSDSPGGGTSAWGGPAVTRTSPRRPRVA